MRNSTSRSIAFVLGIALVVGTSGFLLQAEPPQEVGTWASIGTTDPQATRTGAAVATLPDRTTLVAGGLTAEGVATDSIVIHDPLTNSSTQVGQLLVARVNASATRLDDGRVLVTGGDVGGIISSDVEIFDPASGESEFAALLLEPRTGHASALLTDGTVLIVGGTTAGGMVLATTERFDPSTNSVSAAESMAVARTGASATTLIDGRVLVVGGRDDAQEDLKSAEIYSPVDGEFLSVPTQMSEARSGHSAVLLPHNNSVLIAGGTSSDSAVTTTDLFLPAMFPDPYSWGMGTFGPTDPQELARMTMVQPRSRAVAGPWGDDGYAFAMGGGSGDGEVYRFATIKTDKDDYAPGELAVITGSGWEPLEEVTLVFQEDPAVHDDYVLTVVADDEGNIYHDQWAPEEHDLGIRFYLMATGLTSQRRAQTTFTDNRAITAATVDGGATTTVASGASITASVTVNTTAMGGGGQNWFSTSWVYATASPGGSFNAPCADTSDQTTAGTFSESFTTTAPTAPGVYNAYFLAWRTAACGNNPSNLFTLSNAVTVIAPSVTVAVAPLSVTEDGVPNLVYTFTRTGGTASALGVNFSASGTATYSPIGQDYAVSGTGVAFDPSLGTGTVSIPVGSLTAAITVNPTLDTTVESDETAILAVTTGPGYTVGSPGAATGTITNDEQTITFGALPNKTYGDSDFTVSATASSGLTVSFSSLTTGVCTMAAPSTVHIVSAGTCTIRASQAGNANYTAAPNVDRSFTVNKANAVVVVTPYDVAYDGQPHTALVASITGVNGETGATVGTVDVSNSTHTAAGTYAGDTWSFTGTANYNNIAATPITNEIDKANAVVVVTPYDVTYDGLPHTAEVTSVTGVNGETGATVGTVDVSGTTHSNASTYNDTWSFTGTANYNDIAATPITNEIDKANAVVVVTPYDVPYDGLPHTAVVASITGVNGETGATVGTADVSGTTHTNAGTYNDTWSFTGTANYNDIAATPITNEIDKANAVVVVTPYDVPYDGLPHTAVVASITGVNGETGATVGTADVSGTTHTNAGTYNDTWSFTGTANYNDIAATPITNEIDKANAVVVVTPYDVPYDGQPHTSIVASITGVNGETGATVGAADVTGTTHTNAGTYSDTWSFTGTANYNDIAATPITNEIDKANAVVVVTPYDVPYDGLPHTSIVASITGVNGEIGATVGAADVTGTTHTNAGTYSDTWSFTGTANYNDIAATPITNEIDKANAVVVVTPYDVTYDGLPHTSIVASITGVNGEIGATVGAADVTGTTHTNAGTYSDTWSFTGTANYNDIAATPITNEIDQADANVSITPYSGTYDAAPHNLSGAVTGVAGDPTAVGSSLTFGTSYTDAGNHTGTWTFEGGTNYVDESGTAAITISQADANVSITPYSGPYDAAAHNLTGSVVGVAGDPTAVGSSLTFGTSYTDAGNHTGTWTFEGGTNYVDESGTAAITISQADANVSITPYSGTYDAAAHNLTGSVTGVTGDPTAVGSSLTFGTSYTDAGNHTGTWTFEGGTNYMDESGTAAITIGQADANVSITPYSGTYDAAAHNLTGSVTGVAGDLAAAGSSLTFGAGFTNVPGGMGTWNFEGGTNYIDESGTAAIVINKANATVTVTPYNVQWDGNPHTATYLINGVGGQTGATVGTVNVSNTTHTLVGTYPSDYWFFTGTGNYNNIGNTTITDVITTGYCFNGFLSPIGGAVENVPSNGGSYADPVRAFKLGSTIPVKFILNAKSGSACGSVVTTGVHTLQATYYSSAVDSDPPVDASPTDAATTGNQFRLTGTEWHFNLSTKGGGFKAGTWLLKATLQDGSVKTVWVTIKK